MWPNCSFLIQGSNNIVERKLQARNKFLFSKKLLVWVLLQRTYWTVDKGCDKKDFVTTKLKCPIIGVEATGFLGSRFALHFLAPNTENVMVRMKFYKSAHHKHLWWSRPVPFLERNPNPGTVQLSDIQETLFWENWLERTHWTFANGCEADNRDQSFLGFFCKKSGC